MAKDQAGARRTATKAVPAVARPQRREAPAAEASDGLVHTIDGRREMAGYARDNPNALGGDALRQLANERGIALSESAQMTDIKVREQLRYITAARYDN